MTPNQNKESRFQVNIPNYRQKARESLLRAKNELSSNDNSRIYYAALELRMAIEAITYDRANAYAKEIPPSEYDTWQPRKLMQLLLSIDPDADQNCGVGIGFQEKAGEPAENITFLGEENVFNLGKIKSYYDAIGSFLHMPTMKQSRSSNGHDLEKLRSKCNQIIKSLDLALSSPIVNVTIGTFGELSCLRCSSKVRRRTPRDGRAVHATCINCGAEYKVSCSPTDDQSKWVPLTARIPCPSQGCGGEWQVWNDEFAPGKRLTCDQCNENYTIEVGLMKDHG